MRLVCQNDLAELIRAFINAGANIEDTENGILIDFCSQKDGGTEISVAFGGIKASAKAALGQGETEQKRKAKRLSKKLLYGILTELTGIRLPYGSLTGIRPTKLAYEFFGKGDRESVGAELIDYYDVSFEKTALILEIIDNQIGIYDREPKLFDVYIHIPFCPTRCAYCSFITADIRFAYRFLEPYVKCLLDEIELLYEIAGGRCNALYIGGGTPVAIGDGHLRLILDAARRFCPREFTVEAGRPDVITPQNLKIIKDSGANRISINPQTFNQRTLDLIGRRHDIASVYSCYETASSLGLDINMDIIAGLPGETEEDFFYTVDKCAELCPSNITVHNLALKRGSGLVDKGLTFQSDIANKMTDGAYHALKSAGYKPYYMYRQKYMSGNLENCGYTLPGKACVYNVDIMEETHGILAAGAGAISKRIIGEKIDRLAGVKDVKGYTDCSQEFLARKREFFKC